MFGHSICEHSMWARTPKSTKTTTKNEKMNISSWAGCGRTPKSTRITMQTRLQFLGRMLQRQKRQKSPSFIVKAPVKSIGEHRKVWELPRKMNIEEVEEAKKYENLQTKPVLDPFKSTAEHRKVRELPRKMNIEEVEEPETMKIYRQNPSPSVAATRKPWEFTHETNMQARNHENSDEICAQPVRHLDLATPAFYHYRKNPKCYHTVWGKTKESSCSFCWWPSLPIFVRGNRPAELSTTQAPVISPAKELKRFNALPTAAVSSRKRIASKNPQIFCEFHSKGRMM